MTTVLRSTNPTNGKVIAEFVEHSDSEIDSALDLASRAFDKWRRRAIKDRTKILATLADLLDHEIEPLSKLLTEEIGKTLEESKAEIQKCSLVCRYYCEHAERILAGRVIDVEGSDVRVVHLPLGPVLAVMPWNFPFWQVFRFAVPTIAAGNVAVLKHASNVPRVAMLLEELFLRAGFEPGVFQSLLVSSGKVEDILSDRRIKAATVTGSTKAGAGVASTAGARIKKTVLELGGSDAFVVMPSANIEKAAKTAAKSRTVNNGQSCIAAKRFIVHRNVYEQFSLAMQAELSALPVGDPLDANTRIGPLAMDRGRKRLEKQVDDLLQAGAHRVSGARVLPGPGFFFEPGLLAVAADGCAVREELFGPVALLFEAHDIDHAIRIANESPYGLGSSIWTMDPHEIQLAETDIEAGATFVNSLVRSDPRWPFGGVGLSGYGRELASEGIREFVNIKTIVVERQ